VMIHLKGLLIFCIFSFAHSKSVLLDDLENEIQKDLMKHVHYTIPEPDEIADVTYGAKGPYRAPSVHTWWKHSNQSLLKQTTHYYSSLTVMESSKCSYFCTNGFAGGYFGIQQRGKDKVVIFSLWDHQTKAEAVYSGAGVQVSHFGGEGTGVKTILKHEWSNFTTNHFLLEAKPADKKTVYTAWFYRYDLNAWFKMASIQNTMKNNNPYVYGFYSFVEDYSGSGEQRVSINGPTWMKSSAGWVQSNKIDSSSTDRTAKNKRIFQMGQYAGMATGGPDYPNPDISSHNLEGGDFPCILAKVPGIEIDDENLIRKCK